MLNLAMIWRALVAFAVGLVAACSSPARAQTLPANPFSADIVLTDNNTKAVGPDAGTLGITSFTISNTSTSTQQLFILRPIFSPVPKPSCSGNVTGGSIPQTTVNLEPRKTLQLSFPTPLVFNKINGVSCLGVKVTTTLAGGSVEILVNGFSQ